MVKQAVVDKVNLTLLKKLVAELDAAVVVLDKLKNVPSGDNTDLVIEGSKAAGLAAGIMSESNALIMDIRSFVYGSYASSSKDDILDKLLGNFKPGSN